MTIRQKGNLGTTPHDSDANTCFSILPHIEEANARHSSIVSSSWQSSSRLHRLFIEDSSGLVEYDGATIMQLLGLKKGYFYPGKQGLSYSALSYIVLHLIKNTNFLINPYNFLPTYNRCDAKPMDLASKLLHPLN